MANVSFFLLKKLVEIQAEPEDFEGSALEVDQSFTRQFLYTFSLEDQNLPVIPI